MDLHLKIYGLNAGYEASLPPYLHQLTGKYVSESIKDNIITIQVRNTEYYGSHRVNLTTMLPKTTRIRK